jgi:hypothetical protein
VAGQIAHIKFMTPEYHYCKMVSLSNILTPSGWTTTQVIWELRLEQLDGDQCRFTNTVASHPAEDFLKFIAEHGQTFREAATARQEASGKHCRIETPCYAQSIARWATVRWTQRYFSIIPPLDVLRWHAVDSVHPRPHDEVISVAAAGVNNADLLQRRGHYPVPASAPRPLGLECRDSAVRVVGPDQVGGPP